MKLLISFILSVPLYFISGILLAWILELLRVKSPDEYISDESLASTLHFVIVWLITLFILKKVNNQK